MIWYKARKMSTAVGILMHIYQGCVVYKNEVLHGP